MLSYMLPVEERRGSLRGEERSPGSETRPLLHDGGDQDDAQKLAALHHALHLPPPPPTEEDKLIMEERQKEKTHDPDAESPAPSDDKSEASDALPPPPTDPGAVLAPTPAAAVTAAAKPSLKRVSFGSSKGSMVETLIYDSPVAEEERIPEEEDDASFRDPVSQKFGTETGAQQKPASKVRVTFYESSKPLVVTSPEPSDLDQYSPQDLLMASPIADMPAFDRQLSAESGRDNPFRPDGDISREADQIVELIKSGRPLLEEPASPDAPDHAAPQAAGPDGATEPLIAPQDAPSPQQATGPVAKPKEDVKTDASSPGKAGANGSAAAENSTPGPVEVTHATVSPTDVAHVERVVIKKKNKCSCCVIQ